MSADGRCTPRGFREVARTAPPGIASSCRPSGAIRIDPGTARSSSFATRTSRGVCCRSHSTNPEVNPAVMCCTTRIGNGKSAGSPEKSSRSAVGPPVDAPTPSTSKRVPSDRLAGSPRPWAIGTALRRCRTTATREADRIFFRSTREQSLTAPAPPRSGFAITSRAPAASISMEAFASPPQVNAEKAMMGTASEAMILPVASIPSIPGIWTSIRITPGRSVRAISTASPPVPASPTIRIPASPSTIARMTARMEGESSTTRRRTGSPGAGEDVIRRRPARGCSRSSRPSGRE